MADQVSSCISPKYDWYQTDSHVVLSIMVRGARQDTLILNCTERSLVVQFNSNRAAAGEDTNLHRLEFPALLHPVDPARVEGRVLSMKVEVKLAKREALHWNKLETTDLSAIPIKPAVIADAAPKSACKATYPSSSRTGPKNWDAIGRQAEEEDKPEGDAALNSLFQKIYADGTDEQKKAMMKSFQESGGTVLSTNWDDVNKGKVEVKPPDGMEYKQWS